MLTAQKQKGTLSVTTLDQGDSLGVKHCSTKKNKTLTVTALEQGGRQSELVAVLNIKARR